MTQGFRAAPPTLYGSQRYLIFHDDRTMYFKKTYLSYMGRLESGRTCERRNSFTCSQGRVLLFSFALPPDSIEQTTPVPLRLVLSFSLYSAGLKHRNHIPDSLAP